MSVETAIKPDAPAGPVRWSRRAVVWLAVAAVLLVAVLALWTQRRPIAAKLIDRTLTDWRVPARYHIAGVGLREQRLTNVVLGDPAHPDLVADWIAIDTSLSITGAQVIGVRAGHVRLRGRLVGGKVSLGSIDGLLPKPSGQPFALPAIDLSVDDARMRLETPGGVVGLKLRGSGRLNNGFNGTLAAVAEGWQGAGCRADRLAALVSVAISDGQPTLAGPVRAATISCAEGGARGVVIDQQTTLSAALDRWQGTAQVQLAGVQHPQARLAGVTGRIGYSGSVASTTGDIDVTAAQMAAADTRLRDARMAGRYQLGGAANRFDGTVAARLALADRWQRVIGNDAAIAPGTPIAPLVAQLRRAARAATRDVQLSADGSVAVSSGNGALSVSRLQAQSNSGARLTLNGGGGITYRWGGGDATPGLKVDGLVALSGGGLPDTALRLRQSGSGVMTATGIVRPYATGGARLALDGVNLVVMPNGAMRFAALAVLSGPLGEGWVDGVRLPVSGMWDGGGRVRLNPGCAPFSYDRLALSGLRLGGARMTLCPVGGALAAIDHGRLAGGGRVESPRLVGTLGGAALVLAARHADFRLVDTEFKVAGLAATLGVGDAQTRLAIADLDGRMTQGVLGGRLAGGDGQIGHVPLLLSGATADWRYKDSVLTLTGGLAVADMNANGDPRFKPLDARGVTVTLADNRIAATGALHNPATGVSVTDVRIAHDLSAGAGTADLLVPGITFGPALQPTQLTDLTKGVIALVKGTVSGDAHIAWTRDGVTSNGTFTTKAIDLAAAFGPVRGLAGTIRFTDLLNLVSAPDQVATVAVVNPGVAVENGVVHYRLLAGQKVDVAGAEWPFAGGRLTLAPTLLDFTEHQQRHLTFRVLGIDAAQFLQQFNFKNLNADGVFDGTLPMIFSDAGGRIEGGHLKVRGGGGTIAYVGEVSQKDLGFWGNMAFQALKSLHYRSLEIDMNGPLEGEVITDVRFAGVSQGKGTKSNFVIRRLARLPLVFNVRIQAPFRQLLDSAQGFYDPTSLVKRNLPALLKAQQDAERARLLEPAQPIQPAESEKKP